VRLWAKLNWIWTETIGKLLWIWCRTCD